MISAWPHLFGLFPFFSAEAFKRRKGFDQRKTQKASSKVAAGDAVLVLLPEPEELNVEPENIPLDILYEDDDLLVVNKPKGMVVHPAAGHSSGTLVNAVLYHCRGNLSGINGVLRPGIVHRIDMDTTGALVICKSDFAHQSLAEQLSVHSITRKYRAIVHGNLKEDEETVRGAIGRHPTDRKRWRLMNGTETGGHTLPCAGTLWKLYVY